MTTAAPSTALVTTQPVFTEARRHHEHRPPRRARNVRSVRLAVDATGVGVACEGYRPLADLVKRYEAAGGRYYVCPVSFNAKHLSPETLIGAAEL